MEDKITSARVGAYAARLASRVCETALTGQEAVEGSALLSLTPVRQLNLLVLHSLMHRWKQETARLRSPYFNYDAPQVQQALQEFMTTLSRHIQVQRADLEPLVAEAVTDALGLALDPATTYSQRFVAEDAAGTPFTTDMLRAELKYVEVNKQLFEDFIASLPITALGRATVLTRLRLYATAHFRELAPPEDFLRQLAEIEPVTLAELREPAGARPTPVAAAAPTAAPKPVEMPAASNSPTENRSPETSVKPAEPVATSPTATPSAPVTPAAPPAPQPAPVAPPTPVAQPTPRPPLVAPEVAGTPPAEKLHEKLRHDHEKVTLNDQLRSKASQAPALAEVLETKSKIESISKAITTNQKFAFIAELFDGDRAAYDAAIQKLDALPSTEQAHAYVSDELASSHAWVGKDEHVQKLLRLIDRKFA